MLRLLVVVSITQGACIAGALPPSRADLGTFAATAGGELEPGVRASAGAHSASGADHPVPFDVGGGYVYERVGGQQRGAAGGGESARMSEAVEGAPGGGATAERHGGYLEVSRTLRARRADRQWFGVRAEALWPAGADGAEDGTVGLSARFAWEVYRRAVGSGSFSDSCGGGAGAAYGTAALGFYQEIGYRRSLDGRRSVIATAGVSVRLPVLAGFGFSLCHL